MSFFNSLKKLLLGDRDNKKTEIDNLFHHLVKLTNSPDVVENYLAQYRNLRGDEENGFNQGYIKLYLTWEEFILNNQPTSRYLTKDEFREQITKIIDISKVDIHLRILFLPKRELVVHLYEDFIDHFAKYVILNLGFNSFFKIAKESNPGSVFDNLKINKKGFDFSKLNSVILPNKREFHLAEITRIFKGFVAIFYNKIELSLGAKIAHGIFNKFFQDIQENYDTEIASYLLKVTPERVLNLDEWLSLLSKTELEKEVKVKTSELKDLNNSLEQKVDERTKELKKAYEELKSLDRKKSEFISIAAHQLRTPLSGIKWTLEMLLGKELGDLTDEQEQFLKKTYHTNDNLIEIIDDMLKTDIIIKGKEEFSFKKMNIFDVIDQAVLESQIHAEDKGVKIIKPNRKDGEITGDHNKLFLVLTNLIDNAIKYTGGEGEVTVTAKDDGKEVTICVIDQGIGIPAEEKVNVFDKFFRAGNAIRTQANGSGLGLFISKNIIEKHKGKIWFENNNKKGTKFCFKIPKKHE